MSELKTKANEASVDKFLASVKDEARRAECLAVLSLIRHATGLEPRMWGTSIVGFGSYHYKYESGQEGDWFLTGFSPRKDSLTIYITPGLHRYGDLLAKLGRHSTGKSCLYIKKVSDIDQRVLKTLVAKSVQDMRNLVHERTRHPA